MDSVLKKGNEKKRSLMSWEERKKRRKEEQSKYGDGMAWFRGCLLGKGCFGSVYVANLKKPKSRYSSYPPIMAVKSAEVSVSSSIQKEREVLNNMRGCRNVIRCFGEEITNGEDGQMVYNLLLEYGSGGTLADLIMKSGQNGLPESDVKRHSRSILHGLRHIHNNGYVHCDLKPENILLVPTTYSGDQFMAKIGDLGLAKRAKQTKKGEVVCYGRGTSMYFSPEILSDGVQEAPSDIWAFGCIVLEMFTGNPPPWNSNLEKENKESSSIPSSISREGRSFLKGCLSRKACFRWTAEMLLAHPFLEGIVYNDEDNSDDDIDEELGEVLDINAISSLIVSEDDDDETSMLSFSDGLSYVSEDELLDSCWSEEEVSCFSVEESDASTIPLNELHHYPITFTIASGV